MNRTTTNVRIPWFWIDFGEEEIRRIGTAIRDKHINQGAICREFEERVAGLLGVSHVVTCTNGTAALAMVLMACGIGPGDEVIVPAVTFIATANAARLLGAKVRLVDVKPDRPVIDEENLTSALTERTKAVIAVHLNGAACNMPAIHTFATNHGLRVIEDSAQAFLSQNADGCLGTQSDAGTFSMAISKLVSTGEGGFVAVRDAELCERLRKIRNHGALVVRKQAFDEVGFNFRMTDMTAAMGLAQLDKIPAKIAAARHIYDTYQKGLSGLAYLRVMDIRQDLGELPLWCQAVCAEREKVNDLLARRGIQTRRFHSCLADAPHLDCTGDFPRARFYSEHGLTLPCGPDQKPEYIEETIRALHEIGREMCTPAPICPQA